MPISRTDAIRRPCFPSLLPVRPNTRAHLLSLLLVIVLGAVPETVRAATIAVPAGGSFQAALDSAQPGDTIELAAGATFVGPFTLPDKNTSSTEWITIRTSAPDSSLPPAGQRITPASAPALPKVVTPGFGEPALRTAPRAHHYRFLGVEFVPLSSEAAVHELLVLGDIGANQDSYDEVPHHIVLDRCYVHAHPTQNLKRGIQLNSAHTDILNSYVAGFKVVGQEAQAINGYNGPGPFKIVNNYLEGAGENVLFGGAAPSLPNLVPSDIEIRGNHFYKPLSWREGDPSYAGQPWTVKNILELKNAQRVVIEGNVFENSWEHAQPGGFAILFTPRPNDSGPAAVVQDVQFVKNIVKNSARGINVLGLDDIGCPAGVPDCRGPRLHRVTVAHNLFLNIGAFDGDGRWLQVLSRTVDLTIDHNTAFHSEHGLMADGVANDSFAFTNNLLRRNNPNAVGIGGSSTGEGIPSLDPYFPGADVRKNLIHGVEQMLGSQEQPCWRADLIGCYPAGNFYPSDSTYGGTFEGLFTDSAGGNYRLAAGSPYRNAGTDGKDVGADIGAIEMATAGAVSGVWLPPPSEPGQIPFHGVPFAIPGAIPAANFDEGGAGVAYHDQTAGNGFGSSYRSADVDMYEQTIVQAQPGEWLEYTIDVGATRSTYAILLQLGADDPGGVLHVKVDGTDVTGPLSIPHTGSWGIWGSAVKTGVTLTAGRHVLQVFFDDVPTFIGFEAIRIVDTGQPATPFSGTAINLPGLVPASDFDEGGELVGYHENTAGCAGDCWFRSSDVDLWDRIVLRASAGEWMRYSVNVVAAGTYTLAVEVGADAGGGTFHVELDGVDVTGPLTFPDTGGMGTFQTVTKAGVSLSAGPKTMRIVVDSQLSDAGYAGSFNSVRIQ